MAQGGVKSGVILVLVLSGACAAPPAPQPAPPAPPAPEATEPAPPPPQATVAPTAPKDQCGAQPLQYLVGKPRTQIPAPLAPSRRQVVCSTCVVSRNFVPYRQTITFDSATGLVTSVRCG